MPANREPCFVALFDLLEAIDGFETMTRSLKSWDDVTPAQCPAGFLVKGQETTETRRGLPTIWRLQAEVIIYAKIREGRGAVPSTQLNELLSAIETALQRAPGEPPAEGAIFPPNPDGTFGTTLGGLCYTCAISGIVEVFEGLTGGGSVAIVPIEILTTGVAT